MRELLTARRRAEELTHALEGGSHHLDPSLEAPLRAAVLLREREPVSPPTDFQRELRAALVAEVESAFEPVVATVARRPAHRRRRLTVAAAAVVMVGAGTGVSTAAQQSLPGDLLYPVKRSIESVQLHIARGNAGRGNEYLDEASTRLDEVEGLAAQSAPDEQTTSDITSTLQDFTDQATAGGRLLMAAYVNDGDTAALDTVRKFTYSAAQQMRGLADADVVPDVARDSFTSAAGTVGSLDAAAIIVCSNDCNVALPAVQVPHELLSLETFLPSGQPSTVPSVPEPSPPTSPGLPDITLGPLPPSESTGLPSTSVPAVVPPTVGTTPPDSGPPATAPIAPQTDVPSGVPTTVPTTPPFPAASTPTAPTATGSATTVAPPTDEPTVGTTTIEPTEPTSAPLTTPPTTSAPTVSPPTDSQPLFATPTPSSISIPSASTGQASSSPSTSPPTPSTPSVTP
jgi:hypothetical protein